MEAQETQHGIVEAPVEVAKIRQVYNFLAEFTSWYLL